MMSKRKLLVRSFRILIFAILIVSVLIPGRALADGGSDRKQIIEISYTEYTWRLLRLENNNSVCELKIDHGDRPTGAEIYYQCGGDIY